MNLKWFIYIDIYVIVTADLERSIKLYYDCQCIIKFKFQSLRKAQI